MAILLTGGSGKTSTILASLLAAASPPIPHLSVSRKSDVKFDWLDESTFGNPFQHAFPNGEKITAVYLVSPEIQEPAPPMIAFVDYCVAKHGVTRFVMLTGSNTEMDKDLHIGPVWKHIADRGIDYGVLRATWFMDNLSSEQGHLTTIKCVGKIYTTCADGEIPFISADDIAAVAFHLLIDKKSHNREYRILGPKLLTYDDVADTLSNVLGKKIEHVKLTPDERTQLLVDYGVPEDRAKFVTWLETSAAKHEEKRSEAGGVEEVTGQKPISLQAWAEKYKGAWA